ncbi:hypothetical protein H1R20_g8605, partial [Candolleomyces eurysporus]
MEGESPLIEGAASAPLYSEVAASRPVSRASSPAVPNAGSTPERGDRSSSRVVSPVPAAAAGTENTQASAAPSGDPYSPPVADKDGWTTVSRRRRAYSLDSINRSEVPSVRNDEEEQARAPPVLSSAQIAAVDSAVQQLSKGERDHLTRRFEAVKATGAGNDDPRDSSSSDSSDDSDYRPAVPEPGPSRRKGKAPDPRNWGGLDWDSDEFDEEAQAAALEQFNREKKKTKKKKRAKPSRRRTSPSPNPSTRISRVDSIVNAIPRREQSVLPVPSMLNMLLPPRAPVTADASPDRGARRAPDPRPSAQIPVHSGLAEALRAADRLGDDMKRKAKLNSKKRKKKSISKGRKRSKKAKHSKHKKARRSRRNPSPSSSSSSSDPESSSNHSSSSDELSDKDADRGDRRRRSRRRVPRRGRSPPSGSDSSPSSDSSNSSNSSESESSDDEEEAHLSKHILSNMKVFKFDGNQNIRHFVRHVRETVSSLEMNRVPKKYQVQVAARNLEKKAYDYYEQRIANNASDWTISQMYEALFNHIFPMDFRIGCRGRFNSLTQGGKTITEFAFELEELADLIGDVSEREKVTRLWYGSRPSMQSALWRDRLHPEMSSWEKVLDHALYIELSEKPMKKAESSQSRPFDSKKKSKPAHSGNSQNTNSHSHKTPSHSNQQSSKSSSDRPLNHNPSSSGKSKNKKGTSNQKGSSEQKLSKKEEDELRAANKCFLCKETGHVRRNCPKANSVKSSSNRPPGVSNFNVEFVDVEDTMEGVLDSLHCGSMSFAEDDLRIDQAQQMTENSRRIPSLLYQPGFRWRKPRPDMDDWTYFSRRRVAKQLGNARQKVALNILNSSQPYPGDTVPTGKVLQDRFRFVEEFGEDWLLYDRLLDRYYLIEAYQLRNPDFTPGDWYAQIRQVEAGLKEEMLTNGRRMGDAVAYVAECHLRDGILWYYPTPKSTSQVYHEDRFRVRRHSTEFYEISDYARRSATMIEVSHLENPRFNLARWYHLLVQQKRGHGNRERQFNPEPDSRWSPLPFTSSNADSSDESVESRQSDGTTTPPPLLSISASSDSDSSGSEEEYDPFDLPVREIGDPYAERLRETLCLGAPYPGEESLMEKSHEEILALVNRFAVERTGSEGRTFSIRDTHLDAVFHVPETFAMDPNCSPGSWYARKRAGCIRNGDREFAAWSLTKIKSQISIGA